jgi:CrcB protein
MPPVLLVFLGGGVGSAARYLISTALARATGAYPLGTLVVNVVGSFLMACLMHLFTQGALSPATRLLLTTGFLGGLTTYSSFNYETTHLFQTGLTGLAALNWAVTNVACLLAGLLGFWLGTRLA